MSVIIEREGAVARLTLDRPEVHNAFDGALVARLGDALAAAIADPAVRIIVLGAAGRSFSAGADLGWMRHVATLSFEENVADARRLAALMHALDTCPKPTIARVQGAAFGGGVGLVACCDIAIAVPEAVFALTEVRLGLIPAVISPYLVRAIGARQARRWFLTAERFSAAEALAMNLVHAVVPADRLDAVIGQRIAALLAGGPDALAAAKSLVAAVDRPLDEGVLEETALRIAAARGGAEGREGVAAFLDKRKPSWTV